MSLYISDGVQVPSEVATTLETFTCYRCGQSKLSVVQAAISVQGLDRERWVIDTECLWCGLSGRYFTTKLTRDKSPAWLAFLD